MVKITLQFFFHIFMVPKKPNELSVFQNNIEQGKGGRGWKVFLQSYQCFDGNLEACTLIEFVSTSFVKDYRLLRFTCMRSVQNVIFESLTWQVNVFPNLNLSSH